MGESGAHKKARQIDLENAQHQRNIEDANLKLQQMIYGKISPFAGGLLGAGNNALKGIAPDYFQLGTRNALAGAFGQQRQNLADFLGKSGQGFGGLAAGPAANLGAQESSAMGQSYADALQQALGAGVAGGNMLQGQQGVFNPGGYGDLAGKGFTDYLKYTPNQSAFGQVLGGIGGAALGAGTSFLTGGLSNLTNGLSFLGKAPASVPFGGAGSMPGGGFGFGIGS